MHFFVVKLPTQAPTQVTISKNRWMDSLETNWDPINIWDIKIKCYEI